MRRKRSNASAYMNNMCCWWWRGTCCKRTGRSFARNQWYIHLLVC
jgi:hypothetical protein